MAKEYVLVTQGVEVLRTTDEKRAKRILEENNREWLEYVQNCLDKGEGYADNEMFLYEEGKDDEQMV